MYVESSSEFPILRVARLLGLLKTLEYRLHRFAVFNTAEQRSEDYEIGAWFWEEDGCSGSCVLDKVR